MPIYAYKCSACGHTQDVLQKMSDDKLTVCTACSLATFEKQLTAPGFQLKGSGWYVTDFRGGNKPDAAKPDAAKPDAPPVADAVPKSDGSKTESAAPAAAPAPAPAPASAPASAPTTAPATS